MAHRKADTHGLQRAGMAVQPGTDASHVRLQAAEWHRQLRVLAHAVRVTCAELPERAVDACQAGPAQQ